MMKHQPVRNVVFLATLLALAFSAWGVTPAGADTLTVTNDADSGPGSLRQAIADASASDTITFDGDYTIHLASTLTLSQNLTIDGTGHSLTISGDTNGNGTADVQVMLVNAGVTATLKQLTFTKGIASFGGGIYNLGTLTVTNSTFSGNSADSGGGIYNNQGTLTVTNSTFYGNSATFSGGAIVNSAISPSISDFNGGMLTVKNSTFSGNSAPVGGGIYTYTTDGTCASASDAIIANSTFSGNSASNGGGGIYNENGVITLLFTTVTANTAGGGVFSNNNSETCTKAGGNIIAGNTGYDLSASTTTQRFFSLGYNLVGVAGANVDFTQEFNQTGDQAGVTDPRLAALANNGGPTQTHALLSESPAIDAGDDTACTAWPINGKDQRGVTRPFGAHCDTGAYELNTGSKTFKSQGKYDGWVLESGEFTDVGGSKNNTGKTLLVGDDSQDRQYRTILSFGTASIPDNAVVTKVILKVKKAGVAGNNPINTHNNLVVDIRKAKFYTLPALQFEDFQAKAAKNKAGKFSKKLFSGWYRSVLYTGAYPYINVKGRTQLRLRFLLDDNDNSVADILKLYSGNAALAKRPKMIVEYYVP